MLRTKKETIEYVFEETGSRITDYGKQVVSFRLSADRYFSDAERIREAIWAHVVIRMIYESRYQRKPVSVLLDLHKTHGTPITPKAGQVYKAVLDSASYIQKISVVGDFFQCFPLKQLVSVIPQTREKIHFFLNYQKAKKWLRWTH